MNTKNVVISKLVIVACKVRSSNKPAGSDISHSKGMALQLLKRLLELSNTAIGSTRGHPT